ncbi:MAG TPA: hypothetical protein VF407_04305 [Polyangiaceae bacterium]
MGNGAILGAASFVVILAAAQGCGEAKTCTLQAVVGIVVTVQSDGGDICDAVVSIQDGTYQETLQSVTDSDGGCIYRGADERAGSYAVTVTREGFVPATTAATVSKDSSGCHVVPQFVTVDLQAVGDAGR